MFNYIVLAGIHPLRCALTIEQLLLHSIEPERIILLQKPNYDDIEKSPEISRFFPKLTSREASVTMKHYLALKIIANSDNDIGVVMEDGNLFLNNPDTEITKYLSECGKNWDLIFDSDILGMRYYEGEIVTKNRLYLKSNLKDEFYDGASKGANFIIVRREVAKALYLNFLPAMRVSDFHYNHLIRQLNLRVLWVEPPNVHKIRAWQSTVTTNEPR